METSSPTRLGENPLYGMIGGLEETSASFEARSAPRSYPTIADPAEEMLSDVGMPGARSRAFYSFVTACRVSNLGLRYYIV